MAAMISDWLRHFRLLPCNSKTEFNETWQETRSQCSIPYLCFLADLKTKMAALASDWLIYFRLLHCSHWTNLKWGKFATSSYLSSLGLGGGAMFLSELRYSGAWMKPFWPLIGCRLLSHLTNVNCNLKLAHIQRPLHRSDYTPFHVIELHLLPNYHWFPVSICDGYDNRGRLLHRRPGFLNIRRTTLVAWVR